jgi:hypothetical protein
MGNEEKNYFKRPSIKQIKADKEAIVVSSMPECIEKVIKISSDKYNLDDKFLHIKFNPIPEKFMSFKNPSKYFTLEGRLVDTFVKKGQRISIPLYERLFNTLRKIKTPQLEKRIALATSYLQDGTTDFEKVNYFVLRLNDWIRSAKLRSLEKYTPSALDVKIFFHKKEDYAVSRARISGIGKYSPVHNFSIINVPRRNINSYLDYALMSFRNVTREEELLDGPEYVNRRQLFEIKLKQKSKRFILNPEQILALKITEEEFKQKSQDYLSRISMIPPVSQIAVDIYDILTHHTVINRNPRFNRVNSVPTLADIDVIMLNILGYFSKNKNYSIIRPMAHDGKHIKPENLDFQLFEPELNKFYPCNLYSEPNKKKIIQGL